MFLPIPSIDLMNGEVVRLRRGRADAKTVYCDDPVAVARGFESAGARRLHVVDLDGAFGGAPANLDVVGRIRAAVAMEMDLGGGLRTRDDVRRVLDAGVDDVVLGTGALRDRAMVEGLANELGPRLIVGIDAHDGKVAVEGWVETSQLDALEFARDLEAMGVGAVIFTDIATDGMMTGPNLEAMARMSDAVGMNVIASGGVRHLEDMLALRDLDRANLVGAITGRALYERTIDLAEAVAALDAATR